MRSGCAMARGWCSSASAYGYAGSQRVRKRIEEAFGWIKSVAGLHQTKLRGLAEVDWTLTLAAAYDLVRLQKLIGAT